MISYMPLDDQSILTPNLKNNKLHNLSKNFAIEILPNSTYSFKHGFYFQKYLNQRYFIQLDSELSKKLELEGVTEYENLNNQTININNPTTDVIVINPFQTILYVSSEKIECEPEVDEPKAAEPVDEPVAESVAEPVDEPVAESVAEPVDEPVAESVAEPVDEPVAESVAEPEVAEPVAEPEVAEPVAEPVAEQVVEPEVAEPVAEQVAEQVVEPEVAEPVAEQKRKYVRKKKITN